MEAGMEVPMDAATDAGADRKRFLIPTIVVAILVVAVAAGAWVMQKKKTSATTAADGKEKGGEKIKAPVPVSVALIGTGPIASYITSTANLVAEDEVKIVAESEGRVTRLMVEEGQRVSKGQALAVLGNDDAAILETKARVRANNARATFARAKDMYSKELLSRGDYDKAGMEKEVAEQELAEMQFRLGKTVIRAPFGGTVSAREIRPGQHVRPGEALFTIADHDPLIAKIYLPEKEVLALETGREVRIRLKASDEVIFRGKIRQISPVVDTATGTVKVTVEAVKPPAIVRPGAFVSVDIVRERHTEALLIPREAVIREMQKAHVFVTNGKTATRKAVSLGLEEGDFVEALSGIAAGEKVIVAGQGGLKEGSPIKVLVAGAKG